MKSLTTICGYPDYREPITRKTMKAHMKQNLRDFRINQFKKQPSHALASSFWLSVGATLITFNSVMT